MRPPRPTEAPYAGASPGPAAQQQGKVIGQEIGKEFAKQLKTMGVLATGGVLTGAAAGLAGTAFGGATGKMVGAAGAAATGAAGAVGALATGNVAGAAVSALTGLATAATAAASAAKDFATSAAPGTGFDKTVKLFEASIGLTLLPTLVKFGAALATAGEYLAENWQATIGSVKDQFDDWVRKGAALSESLTKFGVGLRNAVNAVANVAVFADMLATAGGHLFGGGKGVGRAVAEAAGSAVTGAPPGEQALIDKGKAAAGKNNSEGGVIGGIADAIGGVFAKAGTGRMAAVGPNVRMAAAEAAPGKAGFDFEGRFAANTDNLLKDMKASLGDHGQRVTTTNITDAWKKAQEAAGGGPFEKKLLEIQSKALDAVEQLVRESQAANSKPSPVKRGN